MGRLSRNYLLRMLPPHCSTKAIPMIFL